jgi:hypothetical protein
VSEPLVLVVLLGTSADPTTEGLMVAARRALGPEAVVLADTSDAPTDADALAIGERVHARAVARVRWADSSQQVARLHVHVAPSNEWVDDEITFLPQDVANEKGRTIGYTVASMVQRIEREHAEETPTVAPLPPPAVSEPPVAPPSRSSSRVDVFAAGGGALGGAATAAGVSGGIRWWPGTYLGIRAAVGSRFGRIGDADATTMTLFAAVGPGWRLPITSMVELGVRADVLVLRHSVTRMRVVETTRARWLGALDLVVEASWWLSLHLGLFAAAGTELAFGSTGVTVGGMPVTDIPTVRGVGEMGVRFRF